MLVKIKVGGIGRRQVDVLDRKCGTRECFVFGYDKGTYSPGRGYTTYHAKPKPVCMTRLLHGCPTNSVCDRCRRAQVDPPGGECPERRIEGAAVTKDPCGGTLVER